MKRLLLTCHVRSVNSKQWGWKYVQNILAYEKSVIIKNKLDSPSLGFSSFFFFFPIVELKLKKTYHQSKHIFYFILLFIIIIIILYIIFFIIVFLTKTNAFTQTKLGVDSLEKDFLSDLGLFIQAFSSRHHFSCIWAPLSWPKWRPKVGPELKYKYVYSKSYYKEICTPIHFFTATKKKELQIFYFLILGALYNHNNLIII